MTSFSATPLVSRKRNKLASTYSVSIGPQLNPKWRKSQTRTRNCRGRS